MEIVDALKDTPTTTLWAVVATVCALALYRGVQHAAPAFAERYRAQTKQLSERDVRRTEAVIERINGKLGQSLIEYLANSVPFRERVLDSLIKRRLDTVQAQVGALKGELDGHVAVSLRGFERLKGVEVEIGNLKATTETLRKGQDDISDNLRTEARLLQVQLHDVELRIIGRIDAAMDRHSATNGQRHS